MIKGAIFDLDGTLVDSMNMWIHIDTQYLAMHNFIADAEYRKKISELNFYEGAVFIGSIINVPTEKVVKDIYDLAQKEYENTVPLKDGVNEYVKHLKSQNIKLCVATSCLEPLCLASLKKHKIFEYFDYFVYSSDIGKTKSEPDIYLKAANLMSLKSEECMVFEDMYFAARSAKKIGMKVIGIYDEFSKDQQDLLNQNCDKVIKSFKELMID